jgi:hypothetical protein
MEPKLLALLCVRAIQIKVLNEVVLRYLFEAPEIDFETIGNVIICAALAGEARNNSPLMVLFRFL